MEIKDFIENFAEQFDDTTVEMLSLIHIWLPLK